MILPEPLSCYAVFADLSQDSMSFLTNVAAAMTVEREHVFFQAEEELNCFYMVLEGEIALWMQVRSRDAELQLSHQISRQITAKEIIIAAAGPGEMFGWPALIHPYSATSGAKAITPAKVVAFDSSQLRERFERDYLFGYQIMQIVAEIMQRRLRGIRFASQAFSAE